MSRGKTLLLGIAIGAVGIALYSSLRRATEEEDSEEMLDRLERQLAELESRLGSNPTQED